MLTQSMQQTMQQTNEQSKINEFLGVEQALDFHKKTVVTNYRKGQTLTVQGAPVFGVYEIISGIIKTSKITTNGTETIHDLYFPGDCIGYSEVITGKDSMLISTAVTNVKVRFIERQYFSELMGSNLKFANYFIRRSSMKLMETISNECDLKCRSAKSRMKKALELLSFKYQSFGADQLNLSRGELASFAGVATETCIRILSELKKENKIQFNGRNIKVIA